VTEAERQRRGRVEAAVAAAEYPERKREAASGFLVASARSRVTTRSRPDSAAKIPLVIFGSADLLSGT
jgi:hypothetical protein